MNTLELSTRAFPYNQQTSPRGLFWLRATTILLLALALLGTKTHAADITWDGGAGAGSAWLTAGNWAGDIAPAATDNAQFGSVGSSGTIGINMNGTVNNGPNNHAVGTITLLASSTISRAIENSSAATPGTLTLNGVGGVLLANATVNRTLTIANGGGSATMGLALNASGEFSVNGGAQIVINSIISETAGGSKGFTKTGGGTLTLGGINTYTGGTTLTGGTLTLGADNALGSGKLDFAGGILEANNRSVTLGELSLTGGGTLRLVDDTSPSTLSFAIGTYVSGSALDIENWNNTETRDRILIGTDPGTTILANVNFVGFDPGAVWFGGELLPTGVTPVPEPINVALGIFGVVFAGVTFGRRYLARFRRKA